MHRRRSSVKLSPYTRPFAILFVILTFVLFSNGQTCSSTVSCSTGCCSKHGYCGWGDDFCGSDCVNSCDAKKECDANRPCKFGCCSKHGFCGLGGDFCNPDNCVAGCQTKSQCDPGWGLAYSNFSSCALNVCCSKHGFCGTTEDFCGSEVVKRPSCSKGSVDRVIGYYEAWAMDRPCHSIFPEDIVPGVYTHINFAFGSIDPVSFNAVPSSGRDERLWERVQSIRYQDTGVKIWLAIGGWTFNDDDQPTKMAFSDIAASEEHQNHFFTSLIQVMQKYNFDGVDLDWEYPRAPDRSGRDADFKNFPVFLRRLRLALKNANSEYGISVTIPISFWYLQHFDIRSMQESVDWFNTMSYDLHGKWDLSTDYGKEHGAFLNAHTNLTEIADMLDLLWRNDINPQMVNLGLAFYGRSATVANPACSKPGCPFVSAGRAGACSNEAGVLLNTEIDDIIRIENLKPVFDEEAAVKWISWNKDQWVSFDDEETMRKKADFAKSLCLGGVMVWAISHDTREAAYAHSLARAIGHESSKLPGGAFVTASESISSSNQANYCHWAGCGQVCPSGFSQVVQSDDPKSTMSSDDNCNLRTGKSRQFCCPKSKTIPKCRWRGYSNTGQCTPGCNAGEVDIGSSMTGCITSGYQSACCEETASTAPYGQCKWIGAAPNCSPHTPYAGWCPSDFPTWAASSSDGPGGRPECTVGFRTLCCKGTKAPKPFQRCEWKSAKKFIGHLSLCDDTCPSGQIVIARSRGEPNSDCLLSSNHGYCCAGALDQDGDINSRGIADEQVLELEFYLQLYEENPTCPVTPGPLRRSLVAPSKGNGGLSYTGYMTLATILSSVFSVPTMRADMKSLLETRFGYSKDVASIDELHDYALKSSDSKTFFANFLCSQIDLTEVIRVEKNASKVCTNPNSSKASRSTSTLSGASNQEAKSEFSKRIFLGRDAYASANHPTILAALRGAVNGDLTMHYARWLRYGRELTLGLEIAYWIGPQLGVLPDTTIRSRYASTSSPNARYVVFHIHFERDSQYTIEVASRSRRYDQILMFSPATTSTEELWAGASVVNVFHASRVEDFTDAESRVDGSDRDSPYGISRRATVFACLNTNDRWYIGSAARDPNNAADVAISAWGRTLVSGGIADMTSFAYLYPNEVGHHLPGGIDMRRRQFEPTSLYDPIYYHNWLGSSNAVAFSQLQTNPPHNPGTRPYAAYVDTFAQRGRHRE